MSHSTNSNVNFCDTCNLSFNSIKVFLKHTFSSDHQNITRDMIMDLDETETKLETGTKLETRTKLETGNKTRA